MYLQERIEELNSAIVQIEKEKVHITGFLSKERLFDYYNDNIQCYFSKGIYDIEHLDFGKVKDNSIFLVIENGEEIQKYEFKIIKRGTVKYKDENNKSGQATRTYKIRYCKWSGLYSFNDTKYNETFNNKEKLENFITKEYKIKLDLGDKL